MKFKYHVGFFFYLKMYFNKCLVLLLILPIPIVVIGFSHMSLEEFNLFTKCLSFFIFYCFHFLLFSLIPLFLGLILTIVSMLKYKQIGKEVHVSFDETGITETCSDSVYSIKWDEAKKIKISKSSIVVKRKRLQIVTYKSDLGYENFNEAKAFVYQQAALKRKH